MSKYPLEALPGVSIDMMRPMIGHWSGLYQGQPVEEVWFEPIAGQMMGCFRWVRDGAVWMYEFTQFAEVEGELILRIKHFNHDLVGWEEKDRSTSFKLVQILENGVAFLQIHDTKTVWLIYDWSTPDNVRIWFDNETGDHHVDAVFEYQRV